MALDNASARAVPGMISSSFVARDISTEPTRQSPALLCQAAAAALVRSPPHSMPPHSMMEVNSMTYPDNKIGRSLAAAAVALFFECAWPHPGMAQSVSRSDGPIACGDFQRGPEGSWTVLRPTTRSPQGAQLNLAPGQTFAKNQFVGGIEVTTVLDRNCGNK